MRNNKKSEWLTFAAIVSLIVIPFLVFDPEDDSSKYTYQSGIVLGVGGCANGACAVKILPTTGESLLAEVDGPVISSQSVYLRCKANSCRKTWSTYKPSGD